MELPDIEQLGKVIELCRKKGVRVFSLGQLRLELGDEPVKRNKAQKNEQVIDKDPSDPWANFPTGELTNEQLMFYSAGGTPGEEPWLNKGGQE